MTATYIWNTQDGRRFRLDELDNDHLVAILHMGLRAVRKDELDRALEALGPSATADGGAAYLGDLEYDTAVVKANSLSHLRERLAHTRKYGPLVREAARRGLNEYAAHSLS